MTSTALIDELRARVQSMEGRAARTPVATHAALDGLLTLQSGGVYQAGARSLAMLLLAGPSAAGAWAAVVGAPDFGAQAAAELGIDLERIVAVPAPTPEPGTDLVTVLGALIDVVDVLVVAPTRIGEGDAARLAARLRERHCLVITWGDWPRAEARLDWTDVTWHGVGRGHGHLQSRQATLEVRRGQRVTGRRRMWLPDPDLRVTPVLAAPTPLQSVG